MLKFKDGVPLEGLQPDMLYCIDRCREVFSEYGYDCVVTSTTDGDHMIGSLHYIGYAADLRVRHIDEDVRDKIKKRLIEILGINYDVLLHGTVLHYHVEFDPVIT